MTRLTPAEREALRQRIDEQRRIRAKRTVGRIRQRTEVTEPCPVVLGVFAKHPGELCGKQAEVSGYCKLHARYLAP